MPLAGLHAGAEALQGTVHAGGAHAPAHRREAPQVHGKWALANSPSSCSVYRASLIGQVGGSWLTTGNLGGMGQSSGPGTGLADGSSVCPFPRPSACLGPRGPLSVCCPRTLTCSLSGSITMVAMCWLSV